jgi:hypothetical protein
MQARMLSAVLTFSAVFGYSPGMAQPPGYVVDDRAILSLLLAPSCGHDRSGVVFLESVTPTAMLKFIRDSPAVKSVRPPYQEPLLNLLRRNGEPQKLHSPRVCDRVKMVPRSAIDHAIANGWEGTQLTFSLPGYNARGDLALIYEGSQCGNGLRCGEGYLIELRKSNGQWVEDKRIVAWFS